MKAKNDQSRSYVKVRNGHVARTVGSLVQGLCAELPSSERGSVILIQTGATDAGKASELSEYVTILSNRAERNGLLDNAEYKNKPQSATGSIRPRYRSAPEQPSVSAVRCTSRVEDMINGL